MAYYSLPPESNLNDRHSAVAAWFLGPRAENFSFLKDMFESVLKSQEQARKNVYPEDNDFITEDIQSTNVFKENINRLRQELIPLSDMLAKHSVPFWSPRYQAHMLMESSFPAVIGYISTIMYNPNNVATEASPLTTVIEKRVGLQLSQMLGYHIGESKPDLPKAWGHITCDGSVANLESMWAARNLKFYPLSLKLAITEGPLSFLYDPSKHYEIELCTGKKKPFMECSTWELLNLKPSTVLNIPQDLFEQYGLSQTFLQNAITRYLIQTLGKDYLEKYFNVKNQPVYLIGTPKHYSWPKAAAVTGIGSAMMKDVPVDNSARLDAKELDRMLADYIAPENEDERTPIYAVVAIMGSTEQGACDPLAEIIELRTKYAAKGLSFVVHCDAAWGGYFASMIHDAKFQLTNLSHSLDKKPVRNSMVPVQALNPYTADQLAAYPLADSITIDPHKSGYVPYPAGGLCYRDERMRYLVTWSSPVVSHGNEAESIGVYGIEGSKPGAAPVAAWLSHEVIGLHEEGYGILLGEATFTCTKLYSHWSTLTNDTSDLVVVPFNMLPTEKETHPDPTKIEEQKRFIRERIVNRPNSELVLDKEAMELMRNLGGDLMINAFACNFRINGKVNEDVGEANDLNQRIFRRTSITTVNDVVGDRPIILTSTSLAQSAYGGCLTNFKNRLGLKGDQDLYVLINVTMSPWPTANNFLKIIVDGFREIAEEEVKRSVKRNEIFPDKHSFIMQGIEKNVHLVHLPMFQMANRRYQLIVSGDLPSDVASKYKAARLAKPDKTFLLGNVNDTTFFGPQGLIEEGGSFQAAIFEGLPTDDSVPLVSDFPLSNVHIVVKHSLATNALSASYPAQMQFHLYGTPEEQHVDHILAAAPNVQLTSDVVTLELKEPLTKEELASGVIATLTDVYENSMQPFTNLDPSTPTHATHHQYKAQGFTFAPNSRYAVSITQPSPGLSRPESPILTTGFLTLGKAVWADDWDLNLDPAAPMPAIQEVHAVESTPQVAMQHLRADPSSLATEYPVIGGMVHVESRNRIEAQVVRGWEQEWEARRRGYREGQSFGMVCG